MTEEELEAREDFGENLRTMRIEREYSQEYCILKVGCTIRAWYRWENGITYPLPVYRSKIQKMFPELGKV